MIQNGFLKSVGFKKLAGCAVFLSLSAMPVAFAQDEQNAAGTNVVELPLAGKAFLKAQDLKTLLEVHVSENILNGNSSHQLGNVGSFSMGLSPEEINRLVSRIDHIGAERAKLESKLEKDLEAQLAALRLKRRDVQAKRITSTGKEEQKLSKALYESVLEEANLSAQIKKQLEKFDNANLVSLDFVQNNGTRLVQSISLGKRTLWAQNGSVKIARK